MYKYTLPIKQGMIKARSNPRISTKSAVIVCRKINRKNFSKAKNFIENLIEKKVHINRKYYTKCAKEILALLKNLQSNANAQLKDPNKAVLLIYAKQGRRLLRRRRKRDFGVRLKNTNLEAILIPAKKEESKS